MNMQYAQAVTAHEAAQRERLVMRYPTTNPSVRPPTDAP
jgi:hypothetical protein